MNELPMHYTIIEPPSDLVDKVMARIDRERKKTAARTQLFFFGIFLFISVVASYPVWKILEIEMAYSGFGQYLAIAFNDFQTLWMYWQDLGMTLLETLPALSFASMLVVFLTTLVSLRLVIQAIRTLIHLSRIQTHNS